MNLGCRALFFDERFQLGKSAIPLCGDLVEVVADLVHGLRIELEEAFASGPRATDDFCSFQHTKVLGDRLSSEMRARSQLGDRTSLPATKLREQRQTDLISESCEDRGLRAKPC
jgi:hypothetical protein